jgi:EAL domain-containing protein (putative c-di-GMP-specific phosphodiesterase class I)
LQVLLDGAGAAASRLWIEVDESVLQEDHGELKALATMLSVHQTRLGIDHFSAAWTQAFDLPSRGFSFIKLDASLCATVATRSARRDFPKALRGLLGTQPCLVIATGLRQTNDIAISWASHYDAATGPALTRLFAESAAVQRQAVERV